MRKLPSIRGTAIRKDSRKESSFENPCLNNAKIVIPDLDMPGKGDNPCKMPIIAESLNRILSHFLSLGFERTLKRIMALAKKQNIRRYLLSKNILKKN